MPTLNIVDKTVFITGASSGIGAATAKRFAQAKARLLLCARRTERLAALTTQLQREFAVECHYFALDVQKPLEVKERLSVLPENWQDIDILVNNAGLARGWSKLQEGELQDWEEMIDTNIKGLLYVTRQLLPQMVRKKQGHIINIGSIAGHEAYPFGNVYCATKHAVHGLTRALRMDLLGSNVRVSLISPGFVVTEFSEVRFRGDRERARMPYQGMQPLTPDDVADAIIYAAGTPLHVNIDEIIIKPTAQASATMTFRETP